MHAHLTALLLAKTRGGCQLGMTHVLPISPICQKPGDAAYLQRGSTTRTTGAGTGAISCTRPRSPVLRTQTDRHRKGERARPGRARARLMLLYSHTHITRATTSAQTRIDYLHSNSAYLSFRWVRRILDCAGAKKKKILEKKG